ncbi:MAG: NAD(P)/FAD-dependent oxidoreductase [Kineosporiaceae bacterium]
MTERPRHHAVVIGSGFGGLFAAKRLARARDVDVTLISRTGHHLFQPLLYQVATGILSSGEIAPATREILRRARNVRVILGDVLDIDLDAGTVTSVATDRTTVTPYDSLVLATGAGQSYFGNDQFAAHAPGMKSIDDALELRGRIFGAFELAELTDDGAERSRDLTFVVVGAGPTGVEMAGQIAELAHRTLRGEYRRVDPDTARIVLLDAADRVLPGFHQDLGAAAARRLERMGIEVLLGATVVDVDASGIEYVGADGGRRRIEALTKIWAAGVAGNPLGRLVAEKAGAGVDRAGRVEVLPDLTLPGHPEVSVVGDLMALGLPGVAQVAIQSGQHAAAGIVARARGTAAPGAFRYRDKGSMATISRFSAVAEIGRLRFTGFLAWLAWLAIHLLYLIGFKNRVTTLLHWLVSFLGRGRAERVATYQQVAGRQALAHLETHRDGARVPVEEAGPPRGGRRE